MKLELSIIKKIKENQPLSNDEYVRIISYLFCQTSSFELDENLILISYDSEEDFIKRFKNINFNSLKFIFIHMTYKIVDILESMSSDKIIKNKEDIIKIFREIVVPFAKMYYIYTYIKKKGSMIEKYKEGYVIATICITAVLIFLAYLNVRLLEHLIDDASIINGNFEKALEFMGEMANEKLIKKSPDEIIRSALTNNLDVYLIDNKLIDKLPYKQKLSMLVIIETMNSILKEYLQREETHTLNKIISKNKKTITH